MHVFKCLRCSLTLSLSLSLSLSHTHTHTPSCTFLIPSPILLVACCTHHLGVVSALLTAGKFPPTRILFTQQHNLTIHCQWCALTCLLIILYTCSIINFVYLCCCQIEFTRLVGLSNLASRLCTLIGLFVYTQRFS